MKKKILVTLILSLLFLYTFALGTASETGLKDTTNISKNETNVSKIEPYNDTGQEAVKEAETTDVSEEDRIKTEEEKLEQTKTVDQEIIEIKKRINEISITTEKKRILIDSQTTDVKHVVLEIEPKKALELGAKEITIREFILEKNAVPEGRRELKLLRNEMTLGKFVELDLPSEDIDWMIIKIRYNDSEISNNNINEDSLRIIWYDDDPASETFEEWVKLRKGDPEWVHGFGVDQVEDFAWVNVSHTSVYGMVGTIIGPLPTTEPPTPTPEPTTTAPPTTTPAPTTATPTTTPPPTTVAPTTKPPSVIETEEPDLFTAPTEGQSEMSEAIQEMAEATKETVEPTQEKKSACGPTSILIFSLAPLYILNSKIEKR